MLQSIIQKYDILEVKTQNLRVNRIVKWDNLSNIVLASCDDLKNFNLQESITDALNGEQAFQNLSPTSVVTWLFQSDNEALVNHTGVHMLRQGAFLYSKGFLQQVQNSKNNNLSYYVRHPLSSFLS